MPDLAVLVPTRGRPENIRKVISAWDFTNAWDVADLVLIVDADDPELTSYQALVDVFNDRGGRTVSDVVMDEWVPMVHKLNKVAVNLAEQRTRFALGFAGDDHLPQTIGWAQRYLTVLGGMRTGMVYGDDGYQGVKLSTEWAVTSDVVRALGRMVPADVEHMYCDNAMMDLFGGARALKHLPEVRIEHMHPIVGKAETDEQYQRVNHRDQFKKDRRAYEAWRGSVLMSDQLDKIRHLRKGLADVTEPTPVRRSVVGSMPRKVPRRGQPVQRSGPTQPKPTGGGSSPFPRHFKNVRGATPDDIGITLADFARQVPADQEIVELGVFQGRTALQMAWGASQGYGAHVTAIDPWDLPGNVYSPPFTDADSRVLARHWVDTLGYADKITLVHGFSHEVAERWTMDSLAAQVGLLYVDGDHTKDGAKRDIVSWAPHLAEGAIIAVDDYGHPDWPGVGEALDELVAEGFLEPLEIFHDRLAVTRLRATLAGDPGATPTAITSEGVSMSVNLSQADMRALADLSQDPDETLTPLAVQDPGPNLGPIYGPVGDAPGDLTDGENDGKDCVEVTCPVDSELSIDGFDGMTLPELKALARDRRIVLGIRKDKKSEVIQALRDGR